MCIHLCLFVCDHFRDCYLFHGRLTKGVFTYMYSDEHTNVFRTNMLLFDILRDQVEIACI